MAKRPLVLAAALFALGAVIGYAGDAPAWIFSGLAALIGFCLLIKAHAVLPFALLLLVGAWGAAALSQLPGPQPAALAAISGRVSQAPSVEETRVVMTLSQASIDGKRVDAKIRLYCYDPIEVQVGDTVTALCETWRPQGRRNPGGFDFAEYLARRGVRLCATSKQGTTEVQAGANFSPGLVIEHLRAAIGEKLDALYGEDAPLARSILLGDKGALPEDLLDGFRAAGVAHLLAVSGLHIACLAEAIAWLLRRLGASRKTAFFVTAPLTVLYAVLVGLPASAVRAALMFVLTGGARLTGRPYDSLTALMAALLILLAVNPLSIGDPGLILSFSAIGGILLLAPRLRLLPKRGERGFVRFIRRFALDPLAISLAAQIATLPAVCSMYGAITPYAVLTNLVAVPLSTLALPVLAASVALQALAPLAVCAISLPGLVCLKALHGLTALVSGLPGAVIACGAWPWLICAACAALCFLASPYIRLPAWLGRALVLSPVALVLVVFGYGRLMVPKGLEIIFFDAGQADSAALSAEGKLYFADLGEESSPADDYARYTGRQVDGVFLTHPHSDHAGGLKELLASRFVPVIYLPGCWNQLSDADPGVMEMVEAAARKGSEIRYLWAGDRVALSDGVTVTIHAPPAGQSPKEANQASLMLRVQYGEGAAMIAGDLPIKGEPEPPGECQVVKISHHGSAQSNSTFLLRALRPRAAVISVGRNGYGHPAPALLERIENAGADVFRTDRSGAVTARVFVDGMIEMETFL